MTVSAPDYTAQILGAPNVQVSMDQDAGRITFDGGRAPHVEANSIRIALPNPTLLDSLDPRAGRRLEITAGGRVFNLGIRRARPSRGDSKVQLDLASDEELLGDHRPLTGRDMIANAGDVKALVQAVILEALGAGVAVTGPTGSVYPLWAVTNLIPFPTGHSGVSGWVTSTGATNLTAVAPPVSPPIGSTVVRWRAGNGSSIVQAGGWNGVDATKVCAVTPGRIYTASIYLLSSTARPARVQLAFRDENGVGLPTLHSGDASSTSTTEWRRFGVSGVVPKLARYAYIIVRTGENTDGQLHYGQAVMLTEGPFLPEPFTGGSANTADYSYEWAGTAQASASTRTPARDAPDREALYWRAGMSALDFLAPLVQVLGLRLVCNEARAWSLRDASYRAAGGITFRDGVNIIDAGEELSRDSDDWFQGAVFRYTWTDRDGIEQTRDDTYVLPGVSQPKVILREIKAPYPGPGRAQYAVQRAQGRGRTVTATKQATWTEAAEQSFSAVLEGTPIQLGTAERVEFDLATNQVTVTSRTADTPAGAIDLLTGTINALAGTINNL